MIRELNLKEIQDVMLSNLCYFHDFCEQNNLTYYLAYGSLLGAIRHQGFIPWDDDVDVWMPRKDFDRLLALYKDGKLDKKYKLCNRENTNNYPYGIPRLANMEYKYVSTFNVEKQFDIGIFIDIYPLDNYCNSDEDVKEVNKCIKELRSKYFIYCCGKSDNKIIEIPKMLIHHFLHLVYGGGYSKKIDKKISKVLNKYTNDNDKYIGVPTWEIGKRYNKNFFGDRILKDFENKKFYVPVGYKEILTIEYNDYMSPPPPDKRVPNHGYKIYKRNEYERNTKKEAK